MKDRDFTNQEYFSPTEAAIYLGVSRGYIYQLMSARKITSSKLGRRTVLKKSNLDALVTAGERGRTEIKRSTRITKAEANRICSGLV